MMSGPQKLRVLEILGSVEDTWEDLEFELPEGCSVLSVDRDWVYAGSLTTKPRIRIWLALPLAEAI